MLTINPRRDTLPSEIIQAYQNLSPGTLGHILETGMESYIQAVWKPIKLVGPAVTVQTHPQMTSAIAAAMEIAEPGDVLVINRADDTRHAYAGEISCLRYMERQIAGLVTDGPVVDQAALSRMKFPVFSRGSVAMTGKAGGFSNEWGGVNVPVTVGGVTVHPGDMIFADDDGVLVASPDEAKIHLAFVQEKEEWEAWVRGKVDQGWTISQCYAERSDPMTSVSIDSVKR